MRLDRERFLALALGLAACHHHGGTSPVDESGYDPSVWDDPNCTGFDVDVPKCVAWKKGGVAAGYLPTEECVRWDDDNNCTAKMFLRKGQLQQGD
jgi:hypothetical protein